MPRPEAYGFTILGQLTGTAGGTRMQSRGREKGYFMTVVGASACGLSVPHSSASTVSGGWGAAGAEAT